MGNRTLLENIGGYSFHISLFLMLIVMPLSWMYGWLLKILGILPWLSVILNIVLLGSCISVVMLLPLALIIWLTTEP